MTSMMMRQRGLSAITQIVMLFLVGIFIYVVIKTVPHYYEDSLIAVAVEKVETDYQAGTLQASEIHSRLLKNFQMNNINVITADDIRIARGDKGTELIIDYRVEEPVMGNLLLVQVFSHHVTLLETEKP
ncbi:MAG: DUF4845 domain-containing protein [Gammaproteobacteria bacterium]|nr:DUF4845 domain-containing protein [Gammaproteobacteria bacterium]